MRENGLTLRVRPGFFALLAAILLLDTDGVFWCYFLAAVLHEAAHGWAAYRTGGELLRLELGLTGGKLRYRTALSYRAELLVSLAGGAANLAAACICAALSCLPGMRFGTAMRLLSGANLLLGTLNLLPMRILDGGQAIRILGAMRGREAAAQRFLKVATALLCCLFLLFGLYIFVKTRYNTSMLLLAALLTGENLGKRRETAEFYTDEG